MAEELQNLIDRIQKDGVDKADAESERILTEARAKAAALVAEADKQAKATADKATKDAEALVQRGKVSLEQAARDVILSVGVRLDAVLKGLVEREVAAALTPDTLQQMLVHVVEAYCKGNATQGGVDVLLNPEHQKAIADFFMGRFAQELKGGLEIKADGGVVSGFRVSVRAEQVEHDFSAEAIANALSQLLRPHLAEIVTRAGKPAA